MAIHQPKYNFCAAVHKYNDLISTNILVDYGFEPCNESQLHYPTTQMRQSANGR